MISQQPVSQGLQDSPQEGELIETQLNQLSSKELQELHQLTLLESFLEHPNNFIFSGLFLTKDERDTDNPVKPFPDKDYLKYVINAVHESKRIMVPKSRQIHMSWLMCTYALWTALFHPHSNIFFQSKKEEDASMMVFNKRPHNARISFIYEHLPAWLKNLVTAEGTYSKMNFSNGSLIWGIPEGGNIIRSHTATLFISDECAFQPEFENAYTSSAPMAKKIVGISSAAPGYFADLVTEVV